MNETEKQHSRTWQSVCDEFFSTQQASFQESPCPLPSMRLPLWQRALFYRPAADAAAFDVAEMDISEDVKFHFAENGRGDVRIVARVFRIPVNKKGCFRVVSAFLSPESERLADGGDVAALREYVERKYELFRREEGLPTLHYFYVIGSERPFDDGCQALARPTVVLVCRVATSTCRRRISSSMSCPACGTRMPTPWRRKSTVGTRRVSSRRTPCANGFVWIHRRITASCRDGWTHCSPVAATAVIRAVTSTAPP